MPKAVEAKDSIRRTKADIAVIKNAMVQVIKEDKPMTVRQVFYRMVSAGVIGKTEQEYKGTIGRLLKELREEGVVPYQWIADNTRWVRRANTHSSLQDALEESQSLYRRSVWDNQDAYVEIWLEKDALAGVFFPITYKWDVPLLVTRGYPSLSYLYSAADAIKRESKPTFIYYFGDRDPSGVDIPRSVEASLRKMAPGCDLKFEIVAVTPKQIEEMKLATRPTKKTDTRSRKFEGESVEVDAIPPKVIKGIVEGCITQHIDQQAYDRLLVEQEMEKETLGLIAANFEQLLDPQVDEDDDDEYVEDDQDDD